MTPISLIMFTKMQIDFNDLVESVRRGEPNRKPTSVYLSGNVWKDFQLACKQAGIKASPVMERMMQLFVEYIKQTSKEKKGT